MKSWLRIFPHHRRLVQHVQGVARSKVQLEDELRKLRTEIDRLRAQLDESEKSGRTAREMVADWLAQQMFGRPIYGVAPQLPANSAEADVVTRKPHARDLVRQAEREFVQAFQETQE